MSMTTTMFVARDPDGYPRAIDEIDPASEKGRFSGESEDQIRMRYQNLERMSVDELVEEQEGRLRTAPELITEEDWTNALEVLPPCNWVQVGNVESFAFAERYSGRITTLYARVGKTHWRFMDVCTLEHKDIIERVELAIQSATARECESGQA